MKNFAASQKRSVVFSWTLSFVAILLIPILFAFITYLQTERVIENEINQSNQFMIGKIQQSIDGMLENINRLSTEIMFDESIQYMMGGGDDAINAYSSFKAVNVLQHYRAFNSSTFELYIYLKNRDYVISYDTSNDSRTFYTVHFGTNDNNFYTVDENAYQAWIEKLTSNYSGNYVASKVSPGSSSADDLVSYIRSVPLKGSTEKPATLVISIRQAEFLKQTAGIHQINDSNILLLDGNNNIIASTDKNRDFREVEYSELPGRQGVKNISIAGRKMVASYVSSGISDWKYIILVPDSIFWEKAEYIRKFAEISLLACLAFAAVFSFLLIKWNYNPLSKLVRHFTEQEGLNFHKRGNEYGFIEKAMNRELDERKKLSNQVARQNKALREVYIADVIRGKELPGDGGGNQPDRYGIAFSSRYFAVMVYHIENSGGFLFGKQGSISGKQTGLHKFIVVNIVEELVNKNNTAYFTEMDGFLACLVNFTGEESGRWKEQLKWANLEAAEFIKKNFDMDFLVAISSIHPSAAEIHDAYQEALQTMEYKRKLGLDELLYFDEIDHLDKGDYYYPLEREYQLLNCIKAGDTRHALIILDEIFWKNFNGLLLPLQTATCLMFDLVSTMIKALNGMSEENRSLFLQELGPVELVLNCSSLNEMKLKTKEVVEKFCKYVGEKNNSLVLKNNILAYIEKNYYDMNLSVASIAEHFGLHPVYISREFKEQSGIGLLEWITRVRIDHAKELLKSQKSSLEEIAGKVGYANVRTFARAFAKNEGTTPGKYRG